MNNYSKIAHDIYIDAEKLNPKNPDDIGKIKGIIKRYNSFCLDAFLLGKTENGHLHTNRLGGLDDDSEAIFERVKGELKAYAISHPQKELDLPIDNDNVDSEQIVPPSPNKIISFFKSIPKFIYFLVIFLSALVGLLAYFGIQPSSKNSSDKQQSLEKEVAPLITNISKDSLKKDARFLYKKACAIKDDGLSISDLCTLIEEYDEFAEKYGINAVKQCVLYSEEKRDSSDGTFLGYLHDRGKRKLKTIKTKLEYVLCPDNPQDCLSQ